MIAKLFHSLAITVNNHVAAEASTNGNPEPGTADNG
jgi:hypothetical protein